MKTMKTILSILLLAFLTNLQADFALKKHQLDGYYEAYDQKKEGARAFKLNEKTIYIGKEIVSFRKHLKKVEISGDNFLLEFTDEGKKLFADGTRKRIKQKIAIIVNSKCISAPVIRSEINGGRMLASVGDEKESERIVKYLKGLIK